MLRTVRLCFLWLLVSAAAASAQSLTAVDIDRLQDAVFQAGTDLSQVRSREAGRASLYQVDLDDLRDEVIYLKVKLRKLGTLSRDEYSDLRDRIEAFRNQLRTPAPGAAAVAPGAAPAVVGAPAPAAGPAPVTVPVQPSPQAQAGTRPAADVPAGTELEVRMLDSLNSSSAKVEDRFEAATLADLVVGGRVVIPAGALMRGIVTGVEPGTRTNRTARLTVSFDQVRMGGSAYPIRATVTEAIKGAGVKGEAGRLGAGAGVGAVIGGILGGAKGAVAGILIGGGGTMAATEGKDVQLEQGTILRVRFDSPATFDR